MLWCFQNLSSKRDDDSTAFSGSLSVLQVGRCGRREDKIQRCHSPENPRPTDIHRLGFLKQTAPNLQNIKSQMG